MSTVSHHNMIYPVGDKHYDFSHLLGLKHIAIKLSGGADSAAVAYMIWKTIHDNKLDCKVTVLTTMHQGKSFQADHATRIYKWLTREFDSVIVNAHLVNQNPALPDGGKVISIGYVEYQELLVEYAHKHMGVEGLFTGITANPPKEVYKEWPYNGPTDDREDSDQDVMWNPLIYTDKKGVAEIFDYFDIRDLYKHTWSCEQYSWPSGRRKEHCDACWFCKERLWGFGSYL